MQSAFAAAKAVRLFRMRASSAMFAQPLLTYTHMRVCWCASVPLCACECVSVYTLAAYLKQP